MSRRGPGWPTVLALTVVVTGFSVFHPFPLLAVPLALMLLALPPRRPSAIGLSVALLALVFLAPRAGLWEVERGWALLLGGWFVVATAVLRGRPFVERGLAAVAAALASGGVVVALTSGWETLDGTVRTRFREASEVMASVFPARGAEAEAIVRRAAELPAELFPALLTVGSLAALAVGWWGYKRSGGAGEPLGRLTEFRFPDPLIWVLIAGLVLVVAAPGGWGIRLGSNLLFAMGALYALRGLAVMGALIGGHGPALALVALVGLLLWPIVMTGTLVVGVVDTWLDLRAAWRAAGDEG